MQQKREEFLAATETVEGGRLVFLDESGSHVSMVREHAWAPVGERVVGRAPRNRGKVLTMIGALTLDGVEALMTVEGGTSGAVFLTFVREYLVPTLRPGDLVVMDNLGAHHATGVKEAIRAAGADVLYLPPYSPDLNPIELCWSKVKALLRKLAARTPQWSGENRPKRVPSKPAKERGPRQEDSYPADSADRNSKAPLVRQLRGPNWTTWAWCRSRSSMAATAVAERSG